jgi:hypothetical protein
VLGFALFNKNRADAFFLFLGFFFGFFEISLGD